MSSIVYALFADPETAEQAKRELAEALPTKRLYIPLSFASAPLEGNELPESATEFGRNLVLMIVLGAVVMGAAGAIAGAAGWVLGFDAALGLGLGGVTGALMGLVGAMQAGTRRAKAALRELEPRLQAGATLVLIEVERADVDTAVESLERREPELVDVLGS